MGPGTKEGLTLGALEALQGKSPVLLRTKVHPVVPWLEEQGIVYQSFDHYYQRVDNFSELYRQIADQVLNLAQQKHVVYAVPGHPMVAEETVQLIIKGAKEKGLAVKILPAASFLDAVFSAIGYDPNNGLQILDGLMLNQRHPNPAIAAVITQVYSKLVASDVKLSLMEYYPDDHPVTVIKAAGVPGEEKIERIPLYQLDRLDWINHLTCLFVPELDGQHDKQFEESLYPLDPLVNVMAALRGENGCPWDKEQTHQTLKQYLIEETYEVIEALDTNNPHKICEELGDLLLQVVFHAQLAAEENLFNINDVIDTITEKMIRRHPHVFGDVSVENSAEVLVNWDKIKAEEEGKEEYCSLLDKIPKGLPALTRATKLQSKAAKVGFDWPDYRGGLEKVKEELAELQKAIDAGNEQDISAEIGDLFFAAVNLARLLNVDAEVALTATNAKFTKRFQYIEKKCRQHNKSLTEMTLVEMDEYWNEAKCLELKKNGKDKL